MKRLLKSAKVQWQIEKNCIVWIKLHRPKGIDATFIISQLAYRMLVETQWALELRLMLLLEEDLDWRWMAWLFNRVLLLDKDLVVWFIDWWVLWCQWWPELIAGVFTSWSTGLDFAAWCKSRPTADRTASRPMGGVSTSWWCYRSPIVFSDFRWWPSLDITGRIPRLTLSIRRFLCCSLHACKAPTLPIRSIS